MKGTLQRLNNYFGGRQYREVFEENRALITELKKNTLTMIGKGKSISHGVAALEYDLAKEINGQAVAT
ncbi:hypothetical protein ACMSFB_25870, partial [Bacteroides thetaiotaomicron]